VAHVVYDSMGVNSTVFDRAYIEAGNYYTSTASFHLMLSQNVEGHYKISSPMIETVEVTEVVTATYKPVFQILFAS